MIKRLLAGVAFVALASGCSVSVASTPTPTPSPTHSLAIVDDVIQSVGLGTYDIPPGTYHAFLDGCEYQVLPTSHYSTTVDSDVHGLYWLDNAPVIASSTVTLTAGETFVSHYCDDWYRS